jgi:hypothetical protein
MLDIYFTRKRLEFCVAYIRSLNRVWYTLYSTKYLALTYKIMSLESRLLQCNRLCDVHTGTFLMSQPFVREDMYSIV